MAFWAARVEYGRMREVSVVFAFAAGGFGVAVRERLLRELELGDAAIARDEGNPALSYSHHDSLHDGLNGNQRQSCGGALLM